ncbi:centrosome-associated zinc finger protein CP190 [Topomyia yanbarensis]|uniref:centrosome-associated zinc finger protein CP190 n=1 Tax=Topomyia yanbarensis TaxID=2498891 RepID=UPI00273C0DE1|nr:centrosome-associated zinc finger protein CP190 [Topomyia yanbarensis]XP_058822538.1 centrosome-associated zinc finger protein CP190 [Topomyia yanbarensis]XP_058822539.1 centrosome-associated zinc finger protein CP190 [Topomyia yanbarensis]XP_058822540.1 centrosome-associated zinc finger protein CP190 [Topomyia yanbarensis]XP_058822541.1 centrosome-associated zinc finger protein CP190 [Topomyia yanbarensis]
MTRITETKSVKVDNWGVFFLQKLQNFFNKTDHCDLTLQFNDNSQLKVHRLVLSACTDYFNMLENTCEMYDDTLIMPLDLQADVIVPIVNFMYTGTLEFQYNMYDKLLKTARDMNMTVLLKLLEAHKQTTRMIQGGRQPIVLNKQAPMRGRAGPQSNIVPPRNYGMVRQPAPVRPTAPQQRVGQVVRHQSTIAPVSTYGSFNKNHPPEPHALMSKYGGSKESRPGPSRFDENAHSDTFEGPFDDITYESKPLVTADQIKKEDEPFEELRKGYTNASGKRPAPSSFSTPIAKKPNLEEVKEFTEAARLRSQMATEEDDSPGLADDTHFDDDDEDEPQVQPTQQLPVVKSSPKQIVIKQESKTSPGAGTVKQITVKDESGNVDHAKIISEVLKKYPHLVKKNKNIKLKIMQKTSPSATNSTQPSAPMKMEVRTATPLKADMSMVRKATEAVRQPPQATSTSAPRKIDSKTMHALIAKGAENMTGPWLCLRCGIDGRPISIPSYKAFRNHLIVKHRERIDARICEHCGWKAEQRNPHLFYHWLTAHNIKSTMKFPTCSECGYIAMNAPGLEKHEEENHQRGDLQQCIYCNKVFAKEMDLYEHMKSLHKEKAREDGVIDFSDDEYQVQEEEETPSQNSSQENKIKILSNITFSNTSAIPFMIDPSQAQTVSQIGGKPQLQLQQITLEPSSEAEALSNVASGIATSLGLVDNATVVIEDPNFQGQYIEHQMATVHGETGTTTTLSSAHGSDQLTKLITEDGTELQLTQSQKDEIFSQLQNSGNGGNVVMVLNDDNFISGSGLQLADGTQLINTTGAQDSNIVVMYSQAAEELAAPVNTVTTTSAPITAGTETPHVQEHEEVAATEKEVVAKKAELTEDELSQASTQPSDKVSEKEVETEQMEVDAESSQEPPAEESVDEEKNASDLNESSDVARQSTQAEADDDDEDEEEEEEADDSKPADEAAKAEKERDKLKLISELEGDWSEDTEEQPTPVEKKEEKQAVQSEPANATEEKKESPATAKNESKINEEDIGQLLDDWNNETKFTESDSDADLEKKLQKVVGEKKEDPKEEDIAMETSTADNTADSVDDSANDSETHVVIVAAESETEASVREDDDADKSQELKTEKVGDENINKENVSEKMDVIENDKVPAKEDEPVEKEEEPVEEEEEPVEKEEDPVEKEEESAEQDEDPAEQDEAKGTEDKAKSKEVVNSLLGDWDEDEDDL